MVGRVVGRVVGESVAKSARAIKQQKVFGALEAFTFGTPGLLLLADGSILLSYYATLEGEIHIRLSRFRML